MDDPEIIITERRSSSTTRSLKTVMLVAPVADDFVNVKLETSWNQEDHDLEEENATKLLKIEPSWHEEEDHDSGEEKETMLDLVKSEYQVQDNWWYSDWNDKEEHGGRESDIEDDDSKDGDYVGSSSDGEYFGDGDSKNGDFVDNKCDLKEHDLEVDGKSLDQSNLRLAIAGFKNKMPDHRALIEKSCFEPYIIRDCPFCGMVFDTLYPWRTHMKVEHNFGSRVGAYFNNVDVNHAKCKTCNAVIRNRIHALRVHVVQHLPYTKIFKCKTCSYTNSTADRVRKHIKNKHFELLQTELTERKLLRNCVYCSDYVGSVKKLSQHIRKEHIHTFKHKMTLVCPVCGESFPRELSWKNHLQRKHQFDTLKGISFEYINHLNSEDVKESSKFRCLSCKRAFGSTIQHFHLMNHAFKHLPYKSYKCSFCNYDCLNKENVIAHSCENLLTEIESKPYLKEKPSSVRYISLKKKTEIIDKLFVCPSCEKHFESVTLWSDHLTNVHHFDKIENLNIKKIDGENSQRNHKCLICDKDIPKPCLTTFQMHAFSHMPHMWTKCKFCLTPIHSRAKCTCKRKSNNVKLALIAYICPRCGKKFGSAQRWESHIVNEHNLRDPTRLNFCKINEIDNEDPLYKCELCGESIKESASSSDLLFNHASSKHMPFKSYKCKNCAESFENMESILTHLDGCQKYDKNQSKNCLEKARCQCSICGYLGKSNDDVDTHFSTQHKFNSVKNPNFSWICIICDLKCNSKEKIMKHISRNHITQLHHEDNSRIKFLCPVSSDCPAVLDSKYEWRSHVSIHHAFNTDEKLRMKKTGNLWQCLECGKVVKRWSRITHKFKHFTKLRFQCRLCDGTYNSLRSTRLHTLRCTGQQTSALRLKIKQLARDRIKKTSEEQKLNNLENTEQAESNCHADPLKVNENTLQTSMGTEKSILLNELEKYITFACPECNIPLDTKTDWHAHISKNHDFFLDNNLSITPITGMKTKQCNECGSKIHGSSLHAQRHKLTHMPYSAFVCRLCNHRSKTQSVLFYHIQGQHLKLGTYPCYFCDLVCQTYVERYDHIKSQHKGVEWPENVCEICMKSLSMSSSKEQHMATHDFNRTIFPCGYCSVRYLNAYNRKKHWKKLHPVEYEAKLAEQTIARKGRSKKKCDPKKPSSTRVKRKADSDDSTYIPIKKLKSSSSGAMLHKDQQDLRTRSSTRLNKKKAHSDDSDDSAYSPIEKPESTKKVLKSKNSSKVRNDINKFGVEPDFGDMSEPDIQHPVKHEFEQLVRNAETKKICKRKKSSNITRVEEEFLSYEDSDDSTYSPIEKPKSTKTVPKSKNSSKARNDIKKFGFEPDFNDKSEPYIQHPEELEFEPVARNPESKNNYKRKKSSNITRVKEEFLSYEDSDDSSYSPIVKPKSTNKVQNSKNSSKVRNDINKFGLEPDFEVKEEFLSYDDSDESTYSPTENSNLKEKRKPTRKNLNLRTSRVVEKINVKSEPESESE